MIYKYGYMYIYEYIIYKYIKYIEIIYLYLRMYINIEREYIYI